MLRKTSGEKVVTSKAASSHAHTAGTKVANRDLHLIERHTRSPSTVSVPRFQIPDECGVGGTTD